MSLTSSDINPEWLFNIGGNLWSTQVLSGYSAAIDPESFSGITINSGYSGSERIHTLEDLNIICVPPSPQPAADDLIGALATISLRENGTIHRVFKFRVKAAKYYYLKLHITLQDILIYDCLEKTYPNTALVNDLYPDTSNSNKGLRVPVVFGEAYHPCPCIYTGGSRLYLLGGNGATITEVRSPKSWATKSTWSAGSYTFSVFGDKFSPIIADSNQDGVVDACGLFKSGGEFLPLPTKYSLSATESKTSVDVIIMDLVLGDFTSILVTSTYSRTIELNGAISEQKKVYHHLSDLLVQGQAVLKIGTDGNRVVANLIQTGATVATSSVVQDSFSYESVLSDEIFDGGYIEFPFGGSPQDDLYQHKVSATASASTNPVSTVLNLQYINNSTTAQQVGSIYFNRSINKKGTVSFVARPSFLTTNPHDQLTLASAILYDSLSNQLIVDSVTIKPNFTVSISSTEFNHPLLTTGTSETISVTSDYTPWAWTSETTGPTNTEEPSNSPYPSPKYVLIGSEKEYTDAVNYDVGIIRKISSSGLIEWRTAIASTASNLWGGTLNTDYIPYGIIADGDNNIYCRCKNILFKISADGDIISDDVWPLYVGDYIDVTGYHGARMCISNNFLYFMNGAKSLAKINLVSSILETLDFVIVGTQIQDFYVDEDNYIYMCDYSEGSYSFKENVYGDIEEIATDNEWSCSCNLFAVAPDGNIYFVNDSANAIYILDKNLAYVNDIEFPEEDEDGTHFNFGIDYSGAIYTNNSSVFKYTSILENIFTLSDGIQCIFEVNKEGELYVYSRNESSEDELYVNSWNESSGDVLSKYSTSETPEWVINLSDEVFGGYSQIRCIGFPNTVGIKYFAGDDDATKAPFRVYEDGRMFVEQLWLLERSIEAPNPAEGRAVIWMSDGTGAGKDGDIMIKITEEGETRGGTLFSFESASPIETATDFTTQQATSITPKDGTYEVSLSDKNLFGDTATDNVTMQLPSVVEGKQYQISNVGSTDKIITIIPNGADLLLGVNESLTISPNTTLNITGYTDGWW